MDWEAAETRLSERGLIADGELSDLRDRSTLFDGFGGVLSFELKGGLAAATGVLAGRVAAGNRRWRGGA